MAVLVAAVAVYTVVFAFLLPREYSFPIGGIVAIAAGIGLLIYASLLKRGRLKPRRELISSPQRAAWLGIAGIANGLGMLLGPVLGGDLGEGVYIVGMLIFLLAMIRAALERD